jgi:L-ascorbate metabolism protein UlaG (beta-lactamase superfamily)
MNPRDKKSYKNHHGKRFSNTIKHKQHTLWEILHWQFTRKPKKWPKWIANTLISQLPTPVAPNTAAITFINHATCLIQTNTLNVLTDPVWSSRVSPFSFIGPARVRDPGLAFEDLPHIDVVLISHNHYDHLDIATLKLLEKKFKPLFFVPLGDKKILKKNGLTKVSELDWWESHTLPNNTQVTLIPAQHFSGRTLIDRNKSLWGGYVIAENNLKILFAGDTGYSPHFKEIFAKFGSMDIALLPIGAYQPQHLMQPVHMDPREALIAHCDLKANQSIAIHFGTFQLTDEGIDDPILDLQHALTETAIHPDAFKVLKEGETLIYTLAKTGLE